MTTVFVAINNETIDIKCEGHSGYANRGMDIVCASISALVYAFCKCADEEEKVEVIAYGNSDGFISMKLKDPKKRLTSALKMLKCGLGAIEQQFPNNLFLEWGEKYSKGNVA